MTEKNTSEINPTWYKDAIIYQLHVKSFFDGMHDGIGDFVGLTQKLGYLESLGITAVWLLPFYPSPLRDDGYDIADYFDINPIYGTMQDFKSFLEEAQKRGIRVITEIVLNHTSDQHAWFKKSRTAKPGDYWRNFYVWSDTNERYRDARIIFKDFETSNWSWDPVGKAYYWHRFYSHQPDLNFENPHVHKMLYKVIDFWLGMGVDGLRLDAVPYLYEQEGANCENLPQTFAFLKKLRAHVEERFQGRMLLAEANQWPEDAVRYFGSGDMCHMAFNFPLMPRMFMALQKEDRFPIIDILDQTPPIPENAQWAIFLRNHDELTLEMVSEEERDFMYRSYARDMSSRINLGIRRRLAPLLQNSRRRTELLNILLLSLPGTPVIYYGDEIGMGDNHFLGDRDGVRTPMQWSPDRNAGFSTVNPQQLYLPVTIDPEYHYQSVNVENEERNLSSLLWWMRRAIALRRTFQAFSRGSMEVVKSNNSSVLSFIRTFGDETVLVVVNLSRFSQFVSFDLARFAGTAPVDIFSGNSFPRISAAPYQMTLGFHDYFWMHLTTDLHADPRVESYTMPVFTVGRQWTDIFDDIAKKRSVLKILPDYLQQRTTAGCRLKPIRQVDIVDRVHLKHDQFTAVILFVNVHYAEGTADLIFLPLTLEPEDKALAVIGEDKGLIFGLARGEASAVIYDCAFHPLFLEILLEMVRNRRFVRGLTGVFEGESEGKKNEEGQSATPVARLVKAGKRNTCVAVDEKTFFKLFRRMEEGANLEIELHKKMSAHDDGVVAQFIGSLTYHGPDAVRYDIGICMDYFHHSRTLWHTAIDAVSQYLEETLASGPQADAPVAPYSAAAASEMPSILLFDKKARIVGDLTARMHRDLAEETNEEFKVEPFTSYYQRSLYQSFRGLTHRVFTHIEAQLGSMPETQAKELRELIAREKEVVAVFFTALRPLLSSVRMRIHGDYHLHQIMVMDEQYRVCDFEGLSTLSFGERRLKRSPLRDIASMVHSLYTAAHVSLYTVKIQEKDRQLLLPKARQWATLMSKEFVQSYLTSIQGASIVSSNNTETQSLLRIFLLERALCDIEHEIESGRRQLTIALHCLSHYLAEGAVISIDTPIQSPGQKAV
jgi:maltose alpha-D-glucosyltransferase / alpha-amylase